MIESKKILDLAKERAESREDVRDAVAAFLSRAHQGEQRAVVVVGIREDGGTDISYAGEGRDTDALLGLLERAKAQMLRK